MKYTFYDKQTGKITKIMSFSKNSTLILNTEDYESCIEGDYSPSKYYIKNGQPVEYPPRPSQFCNFDFEAEQWIEDMDAHWRNLRRERNARLAATDWTQVPDAPVDAAAWATYRQALRDLPANTDDPRYPTWPTPPT